MVGASANAKKKNRGVGKTLTFSCVNSSTDRVLAASQYPVLALDAHETAPAETWANAAVVANICAAHNERKKSRTGELVGTAYVVRDMMRIVDALGEDGLLRFWGIFSLPLIL